MICLILLFIVWGIVGGSSYSNAQTEQQINLSYDVTIEDFSSGKAIVSVKVENVNAPTMSFEMTDETTNITDIKVLDKNENLLNYTKNNRVIHIENNHHKNFKINYIVSTHKLDGDRYNGYIGENYSMMKGEHIFLLPTEARNINKDILISFHIPNDVKEFIPWPKKNGSYFPNENVEDRGNDKLTNIRRSSFAFGDYQTIERIVGGTNVKVIVPSYWPSTIQNNVADDTFQFVQYFTNLFNESIRDEYLMIFAPPTPDGNLMEGGEWSLSQGLGVFDDNFMYSRLTHQLFHRWNGFLDGWDWHPEAELRLLMGEGLNRYYEAKSIITTFDELKEAKKGDWTYLEHLYKQYKEKDKSFAYVDAKEGDSLTTYNQGAVICFALDMKIMEDTNYKYSLDNVVKSLFGKYGYKQGSITKENFINTAKEVTGIDYSEFLDAYVFGTKVLELDAYFEDGGGGMPKAHALILNNHSISKKSPTNLIDIEGHWAAKHIKTGVKSGITQGYGDGTFKPDKTVSVAEFATFLIRGYEKNAKIVVGNSKEFPKGTIDYMREMNFSFVDNPSADITRKQVAELVANSQGFNFDGETAIKYLLIKGMSKGKTEATVEGYKGEDTLTRAEALTFIVRLKEGGITEIKPKPLNTSDIAWVENEYRTFLSQ